MRNPVFTRYLLLLAFGLAGFKALSQRNQAKEQQGILVDKDGVMRWRADRSEATFFGVNYTVPFAYGYRSHKALGVDLYKAIDADVAHFARLGLNAFRVHMWDVELSDTLGNLLENEHLKLFDYLLFQLKKRNIKTMITPIAFWGNGYPERDEKTPGFATKYGKGPSVVKEEAIRAQENYIAQLMKHVNPYTKTTYQADVDIIAMEINNEPHHSGPKSRTTEYVNRLASAARKAGWTKPVFYNISESPSYADAVAAANVVGHSFQWYPTALVAGRTLEGNYLPHVSRYRIPFGDTIASFRKRAKMVYEFDAGDVDQPIMYPAMARSFRTAGFQWATQFAYDPLHTAHANTEYQTHYVNLLFTPEKAVSLLIAAEAFRRLPLNKDYGGYPNDTSFGEFRISFHERLSEMNSGNAFYYTGNTATAPKNPDSLRHIAGTGNSVVIRYSGKGAYFADKLADGLWRLEVYPDALVVSDPFAKASPRKTVTHLQWNENAIEANLPTLGKTFTCVQLTGQGRKTRTENGSFRVSPGVYLLSKADAVDTAVISGRLPGNLSLSEFYARPSTINEPILVHKAYQSATEGKDLTIEAMLAGADTNTSVTLEWRNAGNRWTNIPMARTGNYDFAATVPGSAMNAGIAQYRMIVKKDDSTIVYPGGYREDPYAWDNYHNETWSLPIAPETASLRLFDPVTDTRKINVYNSDWRNNRALNTVSAKDPSVTELLLTIGAEARNRVFGFQLPLSDQLRGRHAETGSFDTLVLRVINPSAEAASMRIGLIDIHGATYCHSLSISKEQEEYRVAVNSLTYDSTLLLPRPYPGFQPLYFQGPKAGSINISAIDKLEVLLTDTTGLNRDASIRIESIYLKKRER